MRNIPFKICSEMVHNLPVVIRLFPISPAFDVIFHEREDVSGEFTDFPDVSQTESGEPAMSLIIQCIKPTNCCSSSLAGPALLALSDARCDPWQSWPRARLAHSLRYCIVGHLTEIECGRDSCNSAEEAPQFRASCIQIGALQKFRPFQLPGGQIPASEPMIKYTLASLPKSAHLWIRIPPDRSPSRF